MAVRGLVKAILILFAFFWVFVLGVDYLNKHDFYIRSYKYFRYPYLFSFILMFSAAVSIAASKIARVKCLIMSGLGVFLILTLFAIVLSLSFSKYDLSPNLVSSHILSHLMMLGRSFGYLTLLTISAYFYGNLVPLRLIHTPILKVAIGLVFISLFFFGLSAFWMLRPLPILVVLILPILMSAKSLPGFLKASTIKPITIDNIGFVGLFSAMILLFYLVINFSYTQAPFPVGFDTRNLYMNISQQVAESNGLIYGYRPYNWELMMATGFVLFKSAPVPLSISFYGYVLAIFAMFHLGTKSLKLNPNNIIFFILLFTVSPAISNQLYIELKTDFALLFYQFIATIVFLSAVKEIDTTDVVRGKMFQLFAILGVLIGFGLGIKMTNMFLLFTLVIALFWLLVDDIIATASIVLLTMALFILVKLDNLSGVRIYHLGLNYVLIGCVTFGAVLFVWAFIRSRDKILRCIKMLSITGVFAFVTLAPWLVKNYNETKSLNPQILLNGASAEPTITIQSLQQNYRNTK